MTEPTPDRRPSGAAAAPEPDPEPPTDSHGESHEHPHREALHDHLEHLRDAAIEAEQSTGRHEETAEEATRSLIKRVARITGGFFLVGLGLVLLVLPGPGLIVLASGLVLLSVDIPFAARLLAKVRARLPADEDGNVPTRVIVLGLAMTVLTLGSSLWWTFLR